MRHGLAALAAVFAVLVLSAVGSAPAWAHAALVSSTPEDGAELERLPDEVTFTFSEDVSEPAYVVVRTADGTSVTSGDPVAEGTTVTQPLDATQASGRITMAYRVVSVDGHPVTGELAFTVSGAGAAADDAAETSADTAPTAAEPEGGSWADHGVHYVVGGALLAVALALLLTSRGRSG